jgi:hypothetical protein
LHVLNVQRIGDRLQTIDVENENHFTLVRGHARNSANFFTTA